MNQDKLETTGVFGVGTAEMERPSVILHTDVKEYNQIKWMFGPQKWNIASCNIRDTSPCEVTLVTEEQINTFRGRLQIDNNGSLTIRNISIEHAGLYTLQTINKSNKSDERKFNVSVSPPKTVNDSESSSCSKCVRQCSVDNVTRVTLSWNCSTCPFLELIYRDSSNNSCVVNNSVSDQTKQLCQPCSDSGLNPGYKALICVLVGVAVAAAVFLYKKCKAEQNEAEPGTSYIMQEIEPLTVEDTECAYRYEKKKRINSHPEESRFLRNNGEP